MLPHLKSARFPVLAATLAAGLAVTLAGPLVAPKSFGFVAAAETLQPSQFQSILANYGTFQPHAKYGEVWVPSRTTVPEGWHPYPPCHWVHSKELGWYFNDKTEWGRIVHHYGRWTNDKNLGWVWVKGEEFSPGWVVWRTSEKWVGWAPLPPEQDIREISAAEFNNDKHWIFMDAKTFSATCNGGTTIVSTPPALYPVILEETKLVTEIKFVNGIAIFVLPPPLIINIVDIDIDIFAPWSPCFLGAWFWNWNWMVNNIVINVNHPGNCPLPAKQLQKPVLPIKSTPPPPPGISPKPERRADVTPPNLPPVVKQPGFVPVSTPVPPVVIDPGRNPRPIDPGIVRPRNPKPIDPGFVKPRLPKQPGGGSTAGKGRDRPGSHINPQTSGNTGKIVSVTSRIQVPKLQRQQSDANRPSGLTSSHLNRKRTNQPIVR